MTKAEAQPVLDGLNQAFTGVDHHGQKILGFVMAAIDANTGTINVIAKRYLKNHDHQDYHGFVNNHLMYVKIHVILETNTGAKSDDYLFITEEWDSL